MVDKVFFIELNEINFASIEYYCRHDRLPTFKKIIDSGKLVPTVSDGTDDFNEPWIQWYSIRTGLKFDEHGVYRLGDSEHVQHETIYKKLESFGFSVGAVCPINTKNDTSKSKFWIPDPWIKSKINGDWIDKYAATAISVFVNENARSIYRLQNIKHFFAILIFFIFKLSFGQQKKLVNLFLRFINGRDWYRAIFLDALLFFHAKNSREILSLDFCSVFLNSGAHIQHHYMLSSSLFGKKNPSWYVDAKYDPIFDVYEVYDDLLSEVLDSDLIGTRVLIATGLSQKAEPVPHIYWRLKRHAVFLDAVKIDYQDVRTRMSRDFHVYFLSEESCLEAARKLTAVTVNSDRSSKVFECKVSGSSLFVTLVWDKQAGPDDIVTLGEENLGKVTELFSFVAIKNAGHDPAGYFYDSRTIPLAMSGRSVEKIFEYIWSLFGGK